MPPDSPDAPDSRCSTTAASPPSDHISARAVRICSKGDGPPGTATTTNSCSACSAASPNIAARPPRGASSRRHEQPDDDSISRTFGRSGSSGRPTTRSSSRSRGSAHADSAASSAASPARREWAGLVGPIVVGVDRRRRHGGDRRSPRRRWSSPPPRPAPRRFPDAARGTRRAARPAVAGTRNGIRRVTVGSCSRAGRCGRSTSVMCVRPVRFGAEVLRTSSTPLYRHRLRST